MTSRKGTKLATVKQEIFIIKMLGKLSFLLLPVLLSAQCSESGCRQILTTRSIGGEEPERNSRPFQVALYSRVGTTGELGFCGGALVHTQWVLTAAHCCFHDGQQVNHVQAILGAHSLYDRYENGRRIVNVESIELHPDWNPATFANDVALLKLANVVQITESVDVIRLPYLSISEFNFAGAAGTVSGWGIAAPAITFISPTLRQRVMSVTTDAFCNSEYENQLPDSIICGLNQTGGTCKGDNGSPMTIFWNATEENILIGIASFVDASGCNEDRPSVFTRVQRYLTWISELTGIVLD